MTCFSFFLNKILETLHISTYMKKERKKEKPAYHEQRNEMNIIEMKDNKKRKKNDHNHSRKQTKDLKIIKKIEW